MTPDLEPWAYADDEEAPPLAIEEDPVDEPELFDDGEDED